jgi:sterol desaturase/sphingolipid hydroxylase (fatty acid hydroxylase superfamily)
MAVVFEWRMVGLLPNEFAASALGHDVQIDDLRRRVFGRILAAGLILPTIFAIELLLVGWADSSVRHLLIKRSKSSLTDFVCFALAQTPILKFLGVAATLGVTLISAQWLHGLMDSAGLWRPSLEGAPLPVQFAAYFLAFSFFDYWSHRLDHSDTFWPLHRYHHSADGFYILSGLRLHPAAFTNLVQQILPATLLGVSQEAIIDVNLFVLALQYLIHSRIDSDFGWIGRHIVQSPIHHRLHHSLAAGRHAGHFSIIPAWDRLFGTWVGDSDPSVVIGVATPYRHGVWILPDLWRDYREFLVGIFRRRPAGP